MPPEQRKRGRPQADYGVIEQLEKRTGRLQAKSRRGKLNFYYLMLAIKGLEARGDHATHWPWLADTNGYYPHVTVLYELGRVTDPEDICWLADQLCTGAFPATEVIRRIRAWRLEQPIFPPASTDSLACLLAQTVKQYAAIHDGVTSTITEEAMNCALNMLEGTVAENEPDDEE
jgi:hypothetical protein